MVHARTRADGLSMFNRGLFARAARERPRTPGRKRSQPRPGRNARARKSPRRPAEDSIATGPHRVRVVHEAARVLGREARVRREGGPVGLENLPRAGDAEQETHTRDARDARIRRTPRARRVRYDEHKSMEAGHCSGQKEQRHGRGGGARCSDGAAYDAIGTAGGVDARRVEQADPIHGPHHGRREYAHECLAVRMRLRSHRLAAHLQSNRRSVSLEAPQRSRANAAVRGSHTCLAEDE